MTVSSVLGLVGGDRDFATHAYAASKGAVISLTRAMAATYAADGIRCNVVCPGLIATAMSARAQADPAIRARLADLQPLTGRLRRAVRCGRGGPLPRGRALRHRYRADRGRRLDGEVSLHVGLDLGGTNVKCAVVERDGDALRVLATDVEPERRRRRAGRGARAGRRAGPGGGRAVRRAGHRRARAAGPLRRGARDRRAAAEPARRLGGPRDRRAGRRSARPAGDARERRARADAGRAAAGRRPGRSRPRVHRARHRRRRRGGDRRPRAPRARPCRGDRPHDRRPGRPAVRMREPRLPRSDGER